MLPSYYHYAISIVTPFVCVSSKSPIIHFVIWFSIFHYSLFFKQEMELSLIGLQNAGKTSLVNVIAVCSYAFFFFIQWSFTYLRQSWVLDLFCRLVATVKTWFPLWVSQFHRIFFTCFIFIFIFCYCSAKGIFSDWTWDSVMYVYRLDSIWEKSPRVTLQ